MKKLRILSLLLIFLASAVVVHSETIGYGTEMKFWVYDPTTEFYPYYQIKARCIDIGLHCYVFLHDEITTDYVEMSRITEFKEEFDYKIYPTTRKFYGNEPSPGLDGKDRIFILFFQMKTDEKMTVWDKLGYYDPADRYVDEIAYAIEPVGTYHSNEKEIIYLNGFDYSVNSSQIYIRTAELFEKIIHFDWMLRRDNFIQPPWIIEGLSTLNRFLNGYGHPDDVISYIIYPQIPLYIDSYSSFSSTSRGQIYLFFLYLYEKYGMEFVRKIMQSPYSGEDSIRNILAEKVNNITLEELFGNWTVANYVDSLKQNNGLWGYENIDINLFPSQTFSRFPVKNQEGTPVYWGNSAMYQFSGGFGNKAEFVFSGETGSGYEIDKNDYVIYAVEKSRTGEYTVFTTEVLPSQMLYYQCEKFGSDVESLGFIVINRFENAYGRNTFSFGRFGPEIAAFNNPAIWHNILMYIRASKIPELPDCYVQHMNDPLKIRLPLEEIGSQLYSASYYIDLKNPTQGEIIVSGVGYDGMWGVNKIFFTYLNYLSYHYKETGVKGLQMKSSGTSQALILKKDEGNYTVMTPGGGVGLKMSDPTEKKALFTENRDGKVEPVLFQRRTGPVIEALLEGPTSVILKDDLVKPVIKDVAIPVAGTLKVLLEDDTTVFPVGNNRFTVTRTDGQIELEISDVSDQTVVLSDMGGNQITAKAKAVNDVETTFFPNPVSFGSLINLRMKFPVARNGTLKFKLYSFNEELMMSEEDEFPMTQDYTCSFDPADRLMNGTYFYKLMISFSDGNDYTRTGKLAILR